MRILRLIILVIFTCFSFLVFLPKQNLYYLVEQKLKQYDIIISNEKFTSQLFGFRLQDATLHIKGIYISSLEDVNVSFLGVDVLSKEIGYATTTVNINTQSIIINFKPTQHFIQKYKIILKNFKKQKMGVYQYAYKLF